MASFAYTGSGALDPGFVPGHMPRAVVYTTPNEIRPFQHDTANADGFDGIPWGTPLGQLPEMKPLVGGAPQYPLQYVPEYALVFAGGIFAGREITFLFEQGRLNAVELQSEDEGVLAKAVRYFDEQYGKHIMGRRLPDSYLWFARELSISAVKTKEGVVIAFSHSPTWGFTDLPERRRLQVQGSGHELNLDKAEEELSIEAQSATLSPRMLLLVGAMVVAPVVAVILSLVLD